ncbi:MAG: hypothetical protein F8N37_15085 [Telmatospirillum sp.]|nr:hypothetical protein [Telmatospirillum sp.]
MSGKRSRLRLAITAFRHRAGAGRMLTAWLGVVLLSINLFGWMLAVPGGPSSVPPDPSGRLAATVAAQAAGMLAGMPLCHMDGAGLPEPGGAPREAPRRDGDDRRPVCPACFPFGNAATGALMAAPPVEIALSVSRVIEHRRPDDRRAPSSPVPLRYHARAPPIPL